jgi:hypothetical protein
MLYKAMSCGSPNIIAEEFIKADEFSCDFLLKDNKATIIRITRKIPWKTGPFGTIRGYVLVDSLNNGVNPAGLSHYMAEASSALGLERSICMADFMVRGDEIILLEITPRPGGDCLPSLLLNAYNLDIFSLVLDFAQMKPCRIPRPKRKEQFVGLRIHAEHGGILRSIDTEEVSRDPRLREIYLPRKMGEIIRMPPEDYESFLLGHIIFTLQGKTDIENECNLLMNNILVEIEGNEIREYQKGPEYTICPALTLSS